MKRAASVKNSPLDLNVMQTVEIELDEQMLAETDALAKDLQINRSEIFQRTLREVLNKLKITEKERRHRESYELFPVQPDEFEIDEEQLIEAWKDL